MKVFLSYAHADREVVADLRRTLETLGHQVWLDDQLVGGQDWWDRILEEIRSSALVVFAMSRSSNASRPCIAEVGYAVAAARPTLALRVGEGDVSHAPADLGRRQVVDWSPGSHIANVALARALNESPSPDPVPSPPPTPPPAPFAALGDAQAAVRAERLDADRQWALFGQLSSLVADEDARAHVEPLLRGLRDRPELIAPLVGRLEELIERCRPRRARARDRLDALWTEIQAGNCVPVLGFDLTEQLLGRRSSLARRLTEQFEFALATHDRDELSRVAQFVSVMVNRRTLLRALDGLWRTHLLRQAPDADNPDVVAGTTAALLQLAWEHQQASDQVEPYRVLAGLPCRMYVTTHPASLLTEALREAGRYPEVEVCRWRQDVDDWPESIFDEEPGYEPTSDRPLVVQLFGQIERPETLVVTEDDHLDFLHAVTNEPDLIHARIRAAVVQSAVVLLGFDLEGLDTKVLLRSLVAQEGAAPDDVPHLAVQVDLSSSMLRPQRAREYLQRYFGHRRRGSLEIYWGGVTDFIDDLTALSEP